MVDFLARLKELYDPASLEAIKGADSLYGGLIIGILWGIVLQKSKAGKYDIVSSMFRLQDFTVFRVGSVLMITGYISLWLFKDLGIIQLYVPKTVMLPQLLGGLLFGAGIAIMGYCPGTAAVAVGEGMLDGIPAIAGMITGGVIYAEFFHDRWQDNFLKIGDIGRVTFEDLLGVNHWFIIVPLVLMTLMFWLGSTMMDWFFLLAGRMLNYFDEFTVSLEKSVEESSSGLSSYFSSVRSMADRMKKMSGNMLSSMKSMTMRQSNPEDIQDPEELQAENESQALDDISAPEVIKAPEDGQTSVETKARKRSKFRKKSRFRR